MTATTFMQKLPHFMGWIVSSLARYPWEMEPVKYHKAHTLSINDLWVDKLLDLKARISPGVPKWSSSFSCSEVSGHQRGLRRLPEAVLLCTGDLAGIMPKPCCHQGGSVGKAVRSTQAASCATGVVPARKTARCLPVWPKCRWSSPRGSKKGRSHARRGRPFFPR